MWGSLKKCFGAKILGGSALFRLICLMHCIDLVLYIALLTLSVHAPEGYGSRSVCVCLLPHFQRQRSSLRYNNDTDKLRVLCSRVL